MEHLKEISFLDKYPVFRKLAAIGDLRKLSPEEREYYDEDIKIMRDLYATDKWEKEKRRRERVAMQKEMEALRREKEAANREKEAANREKEAANREKEAANRKMEAMRREKEQAVTAIAKNLLSLDLPIIQIMQITGLTQEQINHLKN